MFERVRVHSSVMEPSVDVVEASNEFIELVLNSEGFDETTGEEVQRSE